MVKILCFIVDNVNKSISKYMSTLTRHRPCHHDEHSRNSNRAVPSWDPVDGWTDVREALRAAQRQSRSIKQAAGPVPLGWHNAYLHAILAAHAGP